MTSSTWAKKVSKESTATRIEMADSHTQETAITNYTIAIASTQILSLIKMTNNTTDRFKILARGMFKIDNHQTKSKRGKISLT